MLLKAHSSVELIALSCEEAHIAIIYSKSSHIILSFFLRIKKVSTSILMSLSLKQLDSYYHFSAGIFLKWLLGHRSTLRKAVLFFTQGTIEHARAGRAQHRGLSKIQKGFRRLQLEQEAQKQSQGLNIHPHLVEKKAFEELEKPMMRQKAKE